MSFQALDLPPLLQRNLARLGFEAPTPIQAALLAPVRAGRDVLALAKTGTGKTAAFLVPVIESILNEARRERLRRGGSRKRKGKGGRRPAPPRAPSSPTALVLCPTRELAIQVARDAEALVNSSTLRVVCVHGKVALTPQAEQIASGVHLLVATPGRCRDLIEAGALDLSRVRHVVLDEADRMLDMGFEPQVRTVLEEIPTERQTLLLSATMPAAVEELAGSLLRDPARIEADPSGTMVEHVRQKLVAVDDHLKVPLLLALLAGADRRPRSPRSGVLVFCRTRRRAHWIGAALERHGIPTGFLHGNRSHAQRQRALAEFGEGRRRALVSTDVGARGLHVPAVQAVVNYDVALAPEEHVHRVGRAAHGLEGRGGAGEAFTFLSEDDRARWAAIAEATPAQVDALKPPPLEEFLAGAPGLEPAPAGRSAKGGRAKAPSARKGARQAPRGSRKTKRVGAKRDGDAHVGRGAGGDAAPGRAKGAKDAKGAQGKVGRGAKARRRRPISPREKPGRGVRRLDEGG